MKFIKVFFIVVVVLVVLIVGGLIVFIKTFDVNRVLPKVTEQVSAQLGKGVSIGHAELTLTMKGLSLNARDLVLHQDKSLSSEKVVSVANVSAGLDFMAFVRERQIRVVGVTVKSPRVNIVRNQDGSMNILPAAAPPTTGAASGSNMEKPTAGSAPAVSLPAILVDRITIEDGQVTYSDAMLTPPVVVRISKLSVVVSNFSLQNPFDFEVKAAVFGEQQNIRAAGQVKLALEKMQVEVANLDASVDVSAMDLAQLKKSVPQLKDVFGKTLSGLLKVNVVKLVAGPQGLTSMTASGNLRDGKVALSYQDLTLNPVVADFEMTERDLLVKNFSVGVAGGEIKGRAELSDYLKKQLYKADITVNGLSPAPFVPDLGGDAKFEGTINGQFALSGEGFVPDQVIKNLVGEGKLAVDKGRLVNFNVLKVVLSKIAMVPDLEDKMTAALPENYRQQLNRSDTVFQKIAADLKVSDGLVTIDQAQLVSDVFSVNANGTCDLAQNANVKALFLIPAALAKAMVAGASELAALQETDGAILIPLTSYSGKLANLRVYPDLTYLGKKIIVNRGTTEILKVLDKALGVKNEPAPATDPNAAPVGQSQAPQQGQPAPTAEPRPEEQVIKGLLNTIFKEK